MKNNSIFTISEGDDLKLLLSGTAFVSSSSEPAADAVVSLKWPCCIDCASEF